MGENGPITFPLEILAFDDNRSGELRLEQPLTPDQLETFQAGEFYINIHTTSYNGGELRGQLREAQPQVTRYDVMFSGEAQVPPVNTSATGEATALLIGNVLTLTGSFEGLGGDIERVNGSAVHVHEGRAGESGPIVFNLEVEADAFNFNLRDGTFSRAETLTPE